jgi:DNA (cytosine-5)-methyltransferase 1
MTYLSLFSGGMGCDLAMQYLLGTRCLGYVEIEEFCQKLIRQRQDDGFIDRAPIFGDIRAFNDQGYAEQYKGMVDLITGGFPCQPFSVAGKRQGENDERNMWPATIDTIRIIRPRYIFLENVPGLLASGYFGTVLADLAECGYDVRWKVLSAAEVGARHLRKRLWIVAYANRDNEYRGSGSMQVGRVRRERKTENVGFAAGTERRIESGLGRVVNGMDCRMDLARNDSNGEIS